MKKKEKSKRSALSIYPNDFTTSRGRIEKFLPAGMPYSRCEIRYASCDSAGVLRIRTAKTNGRFLQSRVLKNEYTQERKKKREREK